MWLIEELVTQGFIVAALNHPFDTARNKTDAGVISVWDRPQDLRQLIDHLLADSQWSGKIDETRIGVAGFSSGGYAALALLGAVYDRDLMEQYCSGPDRGHDCELAADFTTVDFSGSSLSYKDERVSAAFVMAPALGPSITESSLREISAPVYITVSADDELVNPEYGAYRYAELISNSNLAILPSGGHFIFLECDAATAVVDWFTSKLDLCGTNFKVDRQTIRSDVATLAIGFFSTNIAETSNKAKRLQ